MALTRATRDLSVGAVVSLAIVIFAVAVMAISKESRLFVRKETYWTSFENTSGLTEGSPVHLVGMQIGAVSRIVFPDDLRESRLRVEFSVDRAFASRIRVGTEASLRALNYLAQDKYIELIPGDPEKAVIEPGGYVEPGTSFLEETLLRGQGIAEDIKEITASLRDLLKALNQGGGLIQEMIHNPEFGRKGAKSLEGSLLSLHSVLEGVEEGRGFAGVLLSDEAFRRKQIDNIDAALTHLRSVMAKLDSGEGMVGQLTASGGAGERALRDLEAAAAAFREVAENLNAGRGLLGRLVSDEEYAQALLRKLDAAVGHAESILGKVDRGEGTLGAAVNDPEVYEGLKDVVSGVTKSRVGKGLVRHYQKKGAKSRVEDEVPEEPEPAGEPERP